MPAGVVASQSYQVSTLNGDGYGIGWYAEEDPLPGVFCSLKPAWNDQNLVQLSQKVSSSIIFAHIRAAGPTTGVSDALCHPFQYGRFLFMHNGCVSGFDAVKRQMLAELDDIPFTVCMDHMCIDSAMAFAVFLNHLPRGPDAEHSSEEMCLALRRTIESFVEACVKDKRTWGKGMRMNFVVSDGSLVLATRCAFIITKDGELQASTCPSLYVCMGSYWGPQSSAEEDRTAYRMHYEDPQTKTVLVSSEPLSNSREEWVPMAPQTMLVVRRQETGTINVLHVPLEILPRLNMNAVDVNVDMPVPARMGPPRTRQAGGGNSRASMIMDSINVPRLSMVHHDSASMNAIAKMKSDDSLHLQHYTAGGSLSPISSARATPHATPAPRPRNLTDLAEGSTANTFQSGWECAERMNLIPPNTARPPPMNSAMSPRASSPGGAGSPTSEAWVSPEVLNQPMQRPTGVTHLLPIMDGNVLVTGDQAGVLRFWDVHNFRLLCSRHHSASAGAISALAVADLADPGSPIMRHRSHNDLGIFGLDDDGTPGGGNRTDKKQSPKHSKTSATPEECDPPNDLLFSGSVNELRVWKCDDLRNAGDPQHRRGEVDLVCLLVFKFLPNLGRVQSLHYHIKDDDLFAGFQNGTLLRFSGLTNSTESLRFAKTRSRGVKFITLELELLKSCCWPITKSSTTPQVEVEERKKPRRGSLTRGPTASPLRANARWIKGRGTSANTGSQKALQHAHLELLVLSGPIDTLRESGECSTEEMKVRGHFGAINAMCFCGDSFASTGGDGRVLVWSPDRAEPMVLVGHSGAVYCIDARSKAHELYTGGADGNLRVWDTKAGQCIVTMRARPCPSTGGIRPGPILSISVENDLVACGHDSGILTLWSAVTKTMMTQVPISSQFVDSVTSPLNVALMSAPLTDVKWVPTGGSEPRFLLATGGIPDGGAKLTDLWVVDGEGAPCRENLEETIQGTKAPGQQAGTRTPNAASKEGSLRSATPGVSPALEGDGEKLLRFLRRFVAVRSQPWNSAGCLTAAKMVASLLEQQLGMAVRFFGTTACRQRSNDVMKASGSHSTTGQAPGFKEDQPGNPVVVGRLGMDKNKPTVVFYSHYDVTLNGNHSDSASSGRNPNSYNPDVNEEMWHMRAESGVLYGLGVAEGKGPLVAQILAVQQWRQKNPEMPVNVVFIAEGECNVPGTENFNRALDLVKSESLFSGTCAIVVNHGRWIDSHSPCLVYGMRGLLDMEVEVAVPHKCGKGQTVETSVAGGFLVEPLMDVMSICGALVESNGLISVPHFYDKVRPISQTDQHAIQMALGADRDIDTSSPDATPNNSGHPHKRRQPRASIKRQVWDNKNVL